MTTTRKRRAEHTVADILRLKPKWFLEKQEPYQERALKNLAYIHTLMEYGQNHIADAPFIELFPDYNLTHDQDEISTINKAIMTYKPVTALARTTGKIAPSFSKLTKLALIPPDKLREALKPNYRSVSEQIRMANRRIDDYRYEIQQIESNIRNYHQSLRTYHRQMREKQREIEYLEMIIDQDKVQVDPEKLKILKEIPDQWVVVQATQDTYTLVRRTPVVMKYIGTAESGMAKTLHMGYMAITFDYSFRCDGAYWVADYIEHGGNSMHPHLSGSSICWGNQAHKAEALMTTKDARGFFDLLENILTTYCPDNPFTDFAFYERRRNTYYRSLAVDDYIDWFKINKLALVRMWAETASDKFLEFLKAEPYIPPKDSSTSLAIHMAELWEKAYEHRSQINARIEEISPIFGVRGEELKQVLREFGIQMPDKNALFRSGVAYTSIHARSLMLYLLVHGQVRIKHGSQQAWLRLSYSSNWDVDWRERMSVIRDNGYIRYNVCDPALENPAGVYDTTTSANFRVKGIPPEERIGEKRSVIRTFGQILGISDAPVTTVAVSAEDDLIEEVEDYEVPEVEYEEEEECYHSFNSDGECCNCGYQCDHNEYDDSGHCRECEHYNAYYDDSASDNY